MFGRPMSLEAFEGFLATHSLKRAKKNKYRQTINSYV